MREERKAWLRPVPAFAVGRLGSLARFVLTPRIALLGSFTGTSLLNYAFSVGAGWLLVPGDFGLLAFAQTLLLIAGLVLQAGVPWVLARSLVNEPSERSSLVRGALAANLLAAFVLAAGVLGLYLAGPLQAGLEEATIAVLLALNLLPIALVNVSRGTAQGLERFGLLALLQVTEVLVKVVAAAALVWLGFGVTGAIFGFLIGSFVAASLGMYFLWAPLSSLAEGKPRWPALHRVVPMFGSVLGLILLLNLGLVAVKLFASDDRTAAGYFQASIVLANAPYHLVASAIVPVMFTQLAKLTTVPKTVGKVGETLGLVLVFVLPLEVLLAAAPDLALGALFPTGYAPAAESLRVLAIGNSIAILAALLVAVFQAIDRPKIPAIVLLVACLGQFAALYFVVPAAGAPGAAAVLSATALVVLAVLAAIYSKEVQPAVLGSALRWFGRYTLALTLAAAFGWLAVSGGNNRLWGLAVAALVYAVALAPLRLLKLPRLAPRAGA